MRINFLASVDLYNPIANFIEKQSKIRLLVGTVVLGIFAGVALYHVLSYFWVNRNVQPKKQQVNPVVKKATEEVFIGDKLPKPDPEVQEKKKPVENVNPQVDVNPTGAQNQPIQEIIIKLDNERVHAYVEKATIMIMEDVPNPPYFPSPQVLKDALRDFPGNVFLYIKKDINRGINDYQLFYRDAALQSIEYLRLDDHNDPNWIKANDIMLDLSYKKVTMIRILKWLK